MTSVMSVMSEVEHTAESPFPLPALFPSDKVHMAHMVHEVWLHRLQTVSAPILVDSIDQVVRTDWVDWVDMVVIARHPHMD
jgi:hypothetical protein